jgi:uncharacterized protein (TIGR02145 family)
VSIGKALGQVGIILAVTATVAIGQTNLAGKTGNFTDSRNGQKYRTVKIGGKTWLGENLNFKTGQSWCYEYNGSNCAKYGRLYDWETAKTACPKGWHLPSREEWNGLMVAVGGVTKTETEDWGGEKITFTYHEVAGKKLKSAGGWNLCNGDGDCVAHGNGTDEFGFSALPGGSRYFSGGGFHDVGGLGSWWSAAWHGSCNAYYRRMRYDDIVDEGSLNRSYGYSVRCVGGAQDRSVER